VEEIDATRLTDRLYIGGMPTEGRVLARAGFSGLVLCAAEHQPSSRRFPGLRWVGHCPLFDWQIEPPEIDMAMAGATAVVDMWERGERLLVTCAQGRNRSGLVCAMALNLITCMPAADCIRLVRRMREPDIGAPVLANKSFVQLIKATAVLC
jgi:hypothetical protein